MQYENPRAPKTKTLKENILDSFFRFIIKPRYDIDFSSKNFFAKFLDIIYFLSIAIVGALVFGFITSAVMKMIGYDMTQNSVVELFEETPIYFFSFMALLWAPLIEESTFRLGLRFSPWKLSVSITFIFATIFFIILDYLPSLAFVIERAFENLLWQNIAMIVVSFILIIVIVLKLVIEKSVNKKYIENLYRNNFSQIFYSLAILFGAIHLLNFKNFGEFWYVSFLLFLPQLSASFILGYIRMKYGILWSMFTHFLYNGFFTVPIILLSILPKSFLENDFASNPDILDSLSSGEVTLISLVILAMLFFVPVVFIKVLYSYYKFKNQKMV